MYQLSIPGQVFTTATLSGVFALFANEAVQATETTLINLEGGAAAVRVTRYNGTLGIRRDGTVAAIVAAMFDEARSLWLSTYGPEPKPWQIRASHWELLFALFDLVRTPTRFLSTDQIDAQQAAAREARQFFNLSTLFNDVAMERFGFGCGGPCVPGGSTNGRHELHVAYALLRNEPIPEAVLSEYRAMDRAFRYDLEWASTLLDVPTLRGRLPAAKLQQLVSVMRAAKQPVTAETVDALVDAVAGVSNAPDFFEVDDALFAAGILSVDVLPPMFNEPVELGTPVNAFAGRLRQILADARRDRAVDQADMERAQGRMSARRHKLECGMALLSHGRETFEWANKVAVALEQRDLSLLLQVLDSPDTRNRSSKRAVEEHYGVKLRGMTAKDRRRAIFALCSMDALAQATWEAADAERKAAARKAEDAQFAKETAQRAQYQRPDGVVIDGARHVEDAIASGFREIRDWRKGASRQYALVNPDLGQARTLRAKDGTLDYARAMLERLAA
ncbi:hypothetical protein FSB08_28300 [Paraburkholderia sp. JPY432]|uniref:hypothetical protein n=1 Tax=Paraburkholderia youngii TaxID=2782701 RepID=UPI0015953184|nr:hypothetical protein [Paraburkholderia youngii]NVH76327.1 hypothetical protein [Paraburkholderia youngii]